LTQGNFFALLANEGHIEVVKFDQIESLRVDITKAENLNG